MFALHRRFDSYGLLLYPLFLRACIKPALFIVLDERGTRACHGTRTDCLRDFGIASRTKVSDTRPEARRLILYLYSQLSSAAAKVRHSSAQHNMTLAIGQLPVPVPMRAAWRANHKHGLADRSIPKIGVVTGLPGSRGGVFPALRGAMHRTGECEADQFGLGLGAGLL